jgi:hypothetical protein
MNDKDNAVPAFSGWSIVDPTTIAFLEVALGR